MTDERLRVPSGTQAPGFGRGFAVVRADLRKRADLRATNRPRTPVNSDSRRHPPARGFDSGNQKAAAHTGCGLIKLGAPGRIRTYAPASGAVVGSCDPPASQARLRVASTARTHFGPNVSLAATVGSGETPRPMRGVPE